MRQARVQTSLPPLGRGLMPQANAAERADAMTGRGDRRAMSYMTLTTKVEEVSENSFDRLKDDGTVETITKVQFSLVVPGMQDRLLAEMPLELAPKPDICERWELEEAWVVVGADRLRAIGYKRPNPRPGEKEAGAMVIFQASEIREATAEERKALQQARKVAKLQAKERRAKRAAEKQAQAVPAGKRPA